ATGVLDLGDRAQRLHRLHPGYRRQRLVHVDPVRAQAGLAGQRAPDDLDHLGQPGGRRHFRHRECPSTMAPTRSAPRTLLRSSHQSSAAGRLISPELVTGMVEGATGTSSTAPTPSRSARRWRIAADSTDTAVSSDLHSKSTTIRSPPASSTA